MTAIPTVPLNTGAGIPQIGLGTWPLTDSEAADAVVAAARAGYRHFDTATRYGNEAGVAEGMRRSGIDRDELFVTTKLDGEFQGGDRAIPGLEAALERMDLDHVDLLLMHWPLPARGQFVSTWKTFEQLHSDGRARAIGVSNFTPAHLDVLLGEASIVPAVNQIQISPLTPRDEWVTYNARHGIVTESWSPLGGPGAEVLAAPELAPIAQAHGVTVGQVVLRWHVQRGLVPLPKSSNPERMAQNMDVFGFELSDDDMSAIAALERPGTGVDPDRDGH
ncbi:MAG TPA: aldo/keto reductase [Pseudolysinimonas sp.]|nr:aldo/keto reductase [Pseudolysinimonas sp.]